MSRSDDEVLVKVEGVSKKFCRSLKKSLWYGVCDIASELNPFRGNVAEGARRSAQLSRDPTSRAEQIEDRVGKGTAGGNQRADSGAFLEGHSQAGLQMDSEKLDAIRSANDPSGSGGHSVILKNVGVNSAGAAGANALDSFGSAQALDARPSTLDASSPALDAGRARLWNAEHIPSGSTLDSASQGLRPGEFWAVRDVSFELRRGECLGLIGHNGAGNQAAGQPLGPRQPGGCTGDCRKAARRVRRVGTSESTLPQAARRVRRRGKARINTTLLKMLNGLIKPDRGSITMRGRVASWSMLKTPQANGAHFFSTLGSGRSTPLTPSTAPCWGSRKRNRSAGQRKGRVPLAGPQGFTGRESREPNRRQDR